ncbi:inverted formin-2-like [Eleutherodactylus coqui]|uniref:inverted formin-2-like n=1 Tax=Eleutherodactylus coqui TaxID=57060 RepID=UPI003461FB5D
MIINMNMGSIDKDIDKDRTAVLYKDLEKYAAPQIPAPPPPPPPIITFSDSSRSLFQKCDPKPRPRLRNFNWEAIPAEKVKGRTSLWSSETFQGDLQIDTGKIEELFGKQEEEVLPKPCYRRRSISIGDACLNKVFLLDSRRSMNIGIFLKQFKRSAAEIVEDIKLGRGDLYTSERLNELLKHLPDREEVQRLKSFQGDKERLNEADLFMLLLLDLPCYCLRLEALILKKDFYPAVLSQLTAARDLTAAAEELLQCTELHFILKLVLKAGNFMNAGGYAGNAAGFRVSSLLKLADTKANKPGMNLLHFVVMEVQKQDPRFLSFADKLQHVHNASKWAEDGLLEEFYRLRSRITSIHQKLAAPELQELRIQMAEFLEYAVHHLREVQKEIDALQASRQNLSEFLCEYEDTFRLEECCKVFSCFCQKFQLAIKENNHREEEDQRQKEWEKKRLQKRHSMATCGALEVSQSKDELEFTLERNLRNTCRPLGRRVCRVRSLGRNSTKSFRTCNDQDEDFQEQCDQKIANQMRKVSEHVLRQQMEYKSQKSGNTDKNNTLYRTSVAKNGTSCQSEAKDDLKKVSLLISKQKTEILQLSPETYGYPTSDPTSDQPLGHDRPRHSDSEQHILGNRTQLQDISELFDNSLQQSNIKCQDKFFPPTEESDMLSKSLDFIEESSAQPLDNHSVGYLILESTQQSKPVDGQDMQISSHHCTSFPPQESTSHWEPKCTSQILLKPIIVHSDVDNASQSQTQFNHVCLTTETQPDNLKAQVSNPLKEMDTHDNDPQILDQSCFPRQMLCLSAHKTFPFSEGLDKLDNQVHEMYTKSVMQCTSKSSMQAVSNSKEVSENNLRNDNSLQILDHNESENPGQSSDFQGLIFSKQTNGLNIMTESSSAPKTSKPLNQVTSKTTKQTVKSLVRNTKRSVAVPGSPVTSPSIPTRFDASNQNQIVNKSETPKPRRSQSGYLMSKIKPVEPLSFKQSNTTKETNDHFPSPKEKNVEPSNETSRGPQYMDYNVYSKSVKDGHTMVQKESHSPCSKWKRELRNTSEKANGVRAEPLLENNVGSNKNNLDHRNGDTIKNSVVGRNGKSIPKKSKTNDLGIRRVPLTKDLFMGSVSTSVVKQPIVTPKHVQKESKTPLKISLVTVGASKSTPGKTTGTVKDKEDSLVNNNDYGKSENSGSPSITSKHCVPSSLKGEAMTPQPSPKKSTSVARVTINVTKHSEVNTTPTRGTRNTYSDTHPIWR